ncbi:MAG: PhoH family protein [Planctomycetia bacterium]|nr:PhoH family protein [Planctomycetia bacterium]
MVESVISVDNKTLVSLFGPRDQHLRAIREALGVTIAVRDGQAFIRGEEAPVAQATQVLEQMKIAVERRGSVSPDEVGGLLSVATGRVSVETPPLEVMYPGRTVKARSAGQARYVEAIQTHDIVFCIGPAGTGKTYLAVAMAVNALKREATRKIVLVRPAVEAGESLGYLPGDVQAKINPYLRPLLDALREMMDYDLMKRCMERDVIEVIPLAYMRGRSLNEAFIILDEAQNTTIGQMKMFLTRMGHGSKIVISGDTTQVDLPAHAQSGLLDAMERLRGIDGISLLTMTTADIVRNPLVSKIIRAYEEPQSRP